MAQIRKGNTDVVKMSGETWKKSPNQPWQKTKIYNGPKTTILAKLNSYVPSDASATIVFDGDNDVTLTVEDVETSKTEVTKSYQLLPNEYQKDLKKTKYFNGILEKANVIENDPDYKPSKYASYPDDKVKDFNTLFSMGQNSILIEGWTYIETAIVRFSDYANDAIEQGNKIVDSSELPRNSAGLKPPAGKWLAHNPEVYMQGKTTTLIRKWTWFGTSPELDIVKKVYDAEE